MDNARFQALLEPWWDMVPPHTLYIRCTEPDLDIRPRFLGLELRLGPAGVGAAETWWWYCEAVELLFLAASVNPTAFKEMMLRRCLGTEASVWEILELEEVILDRLFVHVDYTMVSYLYPTWHLEALAILLTPLSEHSDAYKTTLSELVMLTGDAIPCHQIPVVLSLCALHTRTDESTVHTLDWIVQLHQNRLQEELHNSSSFHRFCAKWVDLAIIAGRIHSRELVHSIETLKSTPGLRLDHVVFPTLRFDKHNRPSVARSLLYQWTNVLNGQRNYLTASREDLIQPLGCQFEGSKHVECRGPTNMSIMALCSSVMDSNGLEHLGFSQFGASSSRSQSRFQWWWLFFALFNGTSRHSVTTLTIEADDIALEDMMAICELVQSPRPLEMLVEPALEEKLSALRPARSNTQPAQVVLRDGAPIHLELFHYSTALTLTSHSTTFDVMGVLNDGYDVLLPGYGQCWVKREDVVAEIPLSEENARDQWRLKTHSITKLSIRLSSPHRDDQERGLRLLLKLIGCPLTHLSLFTPQYQVFNQSYLESVWAHCPNLVSLHIHGALLSSLDVITHAYASRHCQLRHLSLEWCTVLHSSSVFSFIEALADPTTHIAQVLRQMKLSLDVEGAWMTNEMLREFLVMLKKNERLRYVALRVSPDQLDAFGHKFAAFHRQPIRYRRPIASKRAFLSVAEQVGRNLDRFALSSIFSMTHETDIRSVVLSCS